MDNKISFTREGTTITIGTTVTTYESIKYSRSSSLKYEFERSTDTVEEKEYTFNVHIKTKKLEVYCYIKKPITDFNLLENFQDSLNQLGRTDIEITSKNKTYTGYINSVEITEDNTSPVIEVKIEFAV